MCNLIPASLNSIETGGNFRIIDKMANDGIPVSPHFAFPCFCTYGFHCGVYALTIQGFQMAGFGWVRWLPLRHAEDFGAGSMAFSHLANLPCHANPETKKKTHEHGRLNFDTES